MSEVSLYKICLGRVHRLLKKETWKHCSANPFSNLPSGIVDDLMLQTKYDKISISAMFPLLTSGSLTRLDLTGRDLQRERDLLLEVIRTNGLKSLRFLAWFASRDNYIPLIEALIRSCPKLEEFRTCHFCNLDVFQNCKELRVLGIHIPDYRMRDNLLSPENLSMLASLKNLQVVIFSEIMDSNLMADVLKHCPQLISLGHNDSLEALEKIHANITRKSETDCIEVPDHFQLKKCFWGTFKSDRLVTDDATTYKYRFPEKIRIAVSLCPFVEELEIRINHADSIESLKNLKRLTSLDISFLECDSNCLPNFIALLKIIGPNLKLLLVHSKQPLPVDIMCEFCTQLESCEIRGLATASGPVQPHCNVSLKTLSILRVDRNSVLFLLASCKSLVELTIFDARCLDNGLLYQILKRNPLPQLKICDISACSLSERGYRMFLEKAVSLERVKFASFRQDIDTVVKNLLKELNLTNVTYG